MKKLISMLLLSVCLLTAVSCAKSGDAERHVVKKGVYTLSGDEDGPYFWFDPKNKEWRTCAGMAVSYGVSGSYRIEGGELIAGSDPAGLELILSFGEGQTLTLSSVKYDADEGYTAQTWLKEGDVFEYRYAGDRLFGTVCTADDGLEAAKNAGAVVVEDMKCTSGKENWNLFYSEVCDGVPSTVLCAEYYTLDKEHTGAELYEEIKDQYPMLFFVLLDYDGEKFTVTTRESREEEPESSEEYLCLNHYTGEMPSQSNYRKYDRYVLTDDPSVTWDEIMTEMLSSYSVSEIRHYEVYHDFTDR